MNNRTSHTDILSIQNYVFLVSIRYLRHWSIDPKQAM